MAKLLENTYRHINIALVNEMACFCHDLKVDLWDVIDAASTKPFGFQAFRPGPGVGGHCIPIDPNYLSHRVRARLGYPFRFVELAQEINATMPGYIARRIQDQLNLDGTPLRGASVLLLGVTYKANIADTRESPAVPLAKTLLAQGALLRFHDPLVKQFLSLITTCRELTISSNHCATQTSASCCRTMTSTTSTQWRRSPLDSSTPAAWRIGRITSNFCNVHALGHTAEVTSGNPPRSDRSRHHRRAQPRGRSDSAPPDSCVDRRRLADHLRRALPSVRPGRAVRVGRRRKRRTALY